MGTPDALSWLLVVLMVGVSGYHLGRLASDRRRGSVDVDLTHTAMGVAMAMMLAGRLAPDDAGRLAAVFAVPAIWFTGRAVHAYVMSGPRAVVPPLGQAIGSGAMVYMLGLAATAVPMAGMSMPAGAPVLTWLLVTALLGACVPSLTLSRPSVGVGCQVAMSATAAYMLLAL